jgi:hypothetical protein
MDAIMSFLQSRATGEGTKTKFTGHSAFMKRKDRKRSKNSNRRVNFDDSPTIYYVDGHGKYSIEEGEGSSAEPPQLPKASPRPKKVEEVSDDDSEDEEEVQVRAQSPTPRGRRPSVNLMSPPPRLGTPSQETSKLFSLLTTDDAHLLSSKLKLLRFTTGQPIVKSGDLGTSIYFIAEGECVTTTGQTLTKGALFGLNTFLVAFFMHQDSKLPLVGDLASLIRAWSSQNPVSNMGIISSCSTTIVMELEFPAATEIFTRNVSALDFIRLVSADRDMKEYNNKT